MISMEDCERKRADNVGLNVREVVMKYRKDGNQDDRDQDIWSNSAVLGIFRQGREIRIAQNGGL